MGLISNLLAVVFLDKETGRALERRTGAKVRAAPGAPDSQAARAGAQSPERGRLVEEALRVRREKQNLLAHLSPEERQALVDRLLDRKKTPERG